MIGASKPISNLSFYVSPNGSNARLTMYTNESSITIYGSGSSRSYAHLSAEQIQAIDNLSQRSSLSADYSYGYIGFESIPIIAITPNNPPSDIQLSNSAVEENRPTGHLVGALSATDPDTSDIHAFTLISGTGSDDNAHFQINDNELSCITSFNYEAKESYSIRIRATDASSESVEKVFTIEITDETEAPFDAANITQISDSVFTIKWNCAAGYNYQLQYRESLGSGDWIDLGDPRTFSSSLTMSHPDPIPENTPQRFYRVKQTELP